MLYNQPFDVGPVSTPASPAMITDGSAQNAPFVNGNPETGTQGSIPPAASIEYPQREIIAVIEYAYNKGFLDYNDYACQAPSNADLTQLLKAIYGIFNAGKLFAPKAYYVDAVNGSDTNTGQSSSAGAGVNGPFQSIQKALAQVQLFNMNGYNITITVADGTYTSLTNNRIILPPVNGAGIVYLIGDVADPDACRIQPTTVLEGSAPLNAIACNGGSWVVQGFRVYTGTYGGCGVLAGGACSLSLGAMKFGACGLAHIAAVGASQVSLQAGEQFIIEGGATTPAHLLAATGASITAGPAPPGGPGYPSLTILGSVSITNFLQAIEAAQISSVLYATMSITGTVTGNPLNVSMNGLVESGGNIASPPGGYPTHYYPGNGTIQQATGGQYE